MAEVIHRYQKAPESAEEKKQKKEKAKLDAHFVSEKARQVAVRRMQSEVTLARQRGELIEKKLVEAQAAYLLIAMRQKILAIGTTYSRRLVGLKDVKQVKKILDGAAHAILNEIADLPSKVTDPNWQNQVAAEEKDAEGK